MKKLFFTLCCFLATVGFCTTRWAANNNTTKNNDDPSACYVYKHDFSDTEREKAMKEVELLTASSKTCTICCADAGADRTIACNNSSTLGPINACSGTCGGVNCPNTYSWSPSTYLSSTTVEKPIAKRCGPCVGTEVITYTVTTSHSSGCNGGCAQNTDQVTVTFSSGLGSCGERLEQGFTEDEVDSDNIKIFSNNGLITITFTEAIKNAKVEVYAVNGSLIKNVSADGKTTVEINIADQPKGIYIVTVMEGKDKVMSKHVHTDY